MAALILITAGKLSAPAEVITFDLSSGVDGRTTFSKTASGYTLTFLNPSLRTTFKGDSAGLALGNAGVFITGNPLTSFQFTVQGGTLQFSGYSITYEAAAAASFSLSGGSGTSANNTLSTTGTFTANGNWTLAPGQTGTLTATGFGGTDFSQLRSLTFNTVATPPVITVQPQSAVVAVGGAASLSVTATGTAPLAYQWFKDGVRLTGQNGSSLSFPSFRFTNSGCYSVVITNAAGLAISFPARLSVSNAPLWAWGNNDHGQLGNGNTISANRPVSVTSNVMAVAAGEQHSLLVKADGTLWTVGMNFMGQLGNGSRFDTNRPVNVASNVVTVAAGFSYSMFLQADGTLWAMGENTHGQFGNGTNNYTTRPVSVASNVVAVAAGEQHSLLVKADGTLWTMGFNAYGQLGNGSNTATNRPVSVASNVVAVAAGGYHSLFVTADGTLWATGDNYLGQLGNGGNTATNRPVSVASNVVAVAAGYYHSLFMTADGILWAMGDNAYGQLGDGSNTGANRPVSVASNVVGMAAGFYHSLLVNANGTLSAMGWNAYGQLGNGSNDNTNRPVPVSGLLTASLGQLGMAQHSLAVAALAAEAAGLTNQTVLLGQPFAFSVTVTNGDGPFTYQWQHSGTNLPGATGATYSDASAQVSDAGTYAVAVTGQFGNAASFSASLTVLIPPAITAQPQSAVVAVGGAASLSVTNTGTAPCGYQWLKDGALLAGETNRTLSLASFQFTNSGCYSVVITNATGMAISFPASLNVSNAPLKTWGYNAYGQLGIGNNADTNRPVTAASNIVAAAASVYCSFFVQADGTLWATGTNGYGQLGTGSTPIATNRPVLVTSNVVAVAATEKHSLFVRADGTLWGMGTNDYGEFGIGSTPTATNRPMLLTTNVVAVAAGFQHTLFVRADGTLWAMGYNSSGQLGNGNNTSTNRPVSVASNVVAVAAGLFHSLFLKADGTLWAMGQNTFGQLGNGTTSQTNLPVCVASNGQAVAAGLFHSLFAKADGTLWTMGRNDYGQLGNGTSGTGVYSSLPVNVAANVAAVGAGQYHSLFVRGDGTLWTMGYNFHGELGNGRSGSTTSTNLPVQVSGLTAASLGSAGMATHSLAVSAASPQAATLTNQTRIVGQPFAFSVTVTNGDGPFTYQWQHSGTNLAGATSATYSNASVQVSDAGTYAVAVTGPFGNAASFSASLTVLAPPLITAQPHSAVVAIGGLASLSVTNTGEVPCGYQWMKDGVLLLGQTNSSLSFASFQFTNSGSYSVVITNAAGMAISYPASLSVANAPLHGWGFNGFGQLGIGSGIDTNRPVWVASNTVAVAEGTYHSLFVKADGTLWAVGRNFYGELGTGNNVNITRPASVASNVVAVAAGYSYSLFAQADGTLCGMGANAVGTLGNGSNADTNRPVVIASNVVAVAAGDQHSLFVRADGTLWGMGANASGQLGTGSASNTNRPVLIASNVVTAAGGNGHSLFVKADGTLWAVGLNSAGQLGIGSSVILTNRPSLVASNVIAASAGDLHSLFVQADGTLWAMGYNNNGQLGDGSNTSTNRPVLVASNAVAVAAGDRHSLFTRPDGSLWAMGNNSDGRLGDGSNASTNRPVPVSGLLMASLGQMDQAYHSLAVAALAAEVAGLTNQSRIVGQPFAFSVTVTNGDGPFTYQWQHSGTNLPGATSATYSDASAMASDAGTYSVTVTGPFGNAASFSASLTVLVPPTINAQPQSAVVAVGGAASLSVTNTGDMPVGYQWFKDGAMLAGQTNQALSFASFQFTNSGSYQVVVTNAGGMAISLPASLSMSNAPLLAWGNNGGGQLGNGDYFDTNCPINVASNAVAMAAGFHHSLFTKSDGTLWAMGLNDNGQFGNGTTAYANRPVSVASNAVAVAAGAYYSLFVRNDGTLWGMGDNSSGQLGNGTTADIVTTPVGAASNVVAVAAGYGHSLFVKSDGTLWTMGWNNFGQLGNGTTANASRPVSVASNVVAVAAGNAHSMLVKTDGTLWTMGLNDSGQLGNGTTANANRPVSVASNVVAVAAGYGHSLFLKSDGTLWGMGWNNCGQLGTGTFGIVNRPVGVVSNVVAVAAGAFHSLFVKSDGTIWAMGQNDFGQLGNGNTTQQNVPVQVTGLFVASLGTLPQASHSLAVAQSPTPVTVTLGNLAQTYDGTAKPVTVTTDPTNITTAVTYGGSTSAPINAGSYTVIATVTQFGYVGSATNTLVINKATPTATLAVNNSPVTYDGTAKSATVGVTASSTPGAAANILTGGAASQTAAGTYAVTADFVPADTANYETLTGLSAGNFIISNATPDLVILIQQIGADVIASFSGSIETAGLVEEGVIDPSSGVPGTQLEPSNMELSFCNPSISVKSWSASKDGPSSFGNGPLSRLADSYSGDQLSFFFSKGAAHLCLPTNYDGRVLSGNARWNSESFSSLGIDIGSYAWLVGGNNIQLNVEVAPDPVAVTVTIGNLAQAYDGTGKPVTVTTDPTNITTAVMYEGSASAPTNAGSYTVIATVTQPGYVGGATNTLVISKATPGITTWPTASAITQGQALTNSSVSGGSASVPGGFAWELPATVPPVGTNAESVVFTPTDTTNYLSVTGSVSVVVNAFVPVPGVDWSIQNSAADLNWRSVTYGNDLFVAVALNGTGNRVMTSPDGTNWTSRTSAADNQWLSVTYGNGLFVAVANTGAGNRVMTSPDGTNWTARSSAADNGWWSVTYGNGLFVAVASTGAGNRVMTSPDGIAWTAQSSAADNQWVSVTYGNGLFVAVALTGAANRVMTSPDGTNWTARTSVADNQWLSVTYASGLFVAVANTGTGNRVMTSPDGMNWTARSPAVNNDWWSVTYGSGLFAAVASTGAGNRVMTSPDGTNWTARTSAANNQWLSVTYARGLFVAVAETGTGNRVMTSGTFVPPDPSTTTLASSLNPSTYGSSVTFTSTVSPRAASGTVTFKDGATTLGTGTLSGGVATFAISSLSVGSHSLTSEYGGDGSYLASTSSVLTQVVNVAGTVWAGGTTNNWRISDATGTAGSFPGWDCPAVNGDLVITAANTNRITLRVLSLTPPGTNIPGPMANFSKTTAYAWPIVAVSGAIIGFHPDKFTVDTNSLANDLGGGALSLSLSGSNLVLAFVPTANRPPVANPNTMTTVQNLPAVITQARLLANDTDPDGDALSVTGVSPGSASGGTVVSAGGNVTYTPLTNFVGTDSFTYSIADARGGVATATVTVTVSSGASQAQDIAYSPGGVTVKFAGVPGWSYNVQRATNSAGPWTVVHTTNAPATGLFTYTDNYPPDPTGYYRLAKNQ